MLWLDHVLSVPTIGVRIESKLITFPSIEKSVFSFIDYLKDNKKQWRVEQNGLLGYNIYSDEFNFVIKFDNLLAKYAYNIPQKPQAGSFPKYDPPQIRTYNELMDEIFTHMSNIIERLNNVDELKYDLIGIVAETNIEEDNLPPGVQSLIQHLGKPWDNNLRSIKSMILAQLEDTDEYYDRCHNTIEFDEKTKSSSGYRIVLDWQRVFKDKKLIINDNLVKDIENCKDKAFEYFERFGSGDLNYE